MTLSTLVLVLVIALPALALILWPLLRKGSSPSGLLPLPPDRRDEFNE